MNDTTWTRPARMTAAAIAAAGLGVVAANATSADAKAPKPPRTQFVILEHHPAVDADTGDQLGTVVRDLRVIESYDDGDFLFVVNATFKLSDGDIQETGAVRYSDVAAGQAVVAITGGTGVYARSAGSVTGRLGTRDGHDGIYLPFDITRTRGHTRPRPDPKGTSHAPVPHRTKHPRRNGRPGDS